MPMPRLCSPRSQRYYMTLALACLAMTLLFVGPLISQFQAGHHGTAQQDTGHHHAQHDHAAPHHGTAEHHQTAGAEELSHWHVLCGYCELWQHTPTLFLRLPDIARQAFVPHQGGFIAPSIGTLRQFNYPHALTRGPPVFAHCEFQTIWNDDRDSNAFNQKTNSAF